MDWEKASPRDAVTPGCEINVKVPGSTGTVFHLEPDPGDGMREREISPPFQRLELEHERAVTVPSHRLSRLLTFTRGTLDR